MEVEVQRHLEDQFRAMEDGDLLYLTVVQRDRYRPDALELAMQELARRKLPVLLPEAYWQQYPEEWMARVGFCYQCWITTTDESCMATYLDVAASDILREKGRCSVCRSVIWTQWFHLFGIPIFPVGRYRIAWDPEPSLDRFKARRVKEGG